MDVCRILTKTCVALNSPRIFHGWVINQDVNVKYIRTKPPVRDMLVEHLKIVERKMYFHYTDEHRNDKQLRNIKYQINRNNELNFKAAYQILTVEKKDKNHEFVQSVSHVNGPNCPIKTLYANQQIVD